MSQATATLDPIVKPSRRVNAVRPSDAGTAATLKIFDAPSRVQKRRIAFVPSPPTHQRIAEVAYDIWQERGRPEGDELAHWLKAENLLRARQRMVYPRPCV